jgi:hypothetical protein
MRVALGGGSGNGKIKQLGFKDILKITSRKWAEDWDWGDRISRGVKGSDMHSCAHSGTSSSLGALEEVWAWMGDGDLHLAMLRRAWASSEKVGDMNAWLWKCLMATDRALSQWVRSSRQRCPIGRQQHCVGWPMIEPRDRKVVSPPKGTQCISG